MKELLNFLYDVWQLGYTKSQAVARLADRTTSQAHTSSTFGGHVTSSVMWPFDSPYPLWNQASISNGFRDRPIQCRM